MRTHARAVRHPRIIYTLTWSMVSGALAPSTTCGTRGCIIPVHLSARLRCPHVRCSHTPSHRRPNASGYRRGNRWIAAPWQTMPRDPTVAAKWSAPTEVTKAVLVGVVGIRPMQVMSAIKAAELATQTGGTRAEDGAMEMYGALGLSPLHARKSSTSERPGSKWQRIRCSVRSSTTRERLLHEPAVPKAACFKALPLKRDPVRTQLQTAEHRVC